MLACASDTGSFAVMGSACASRRPPTSAARELPPAAHRPVDARESRPEPAVDVQGATRAAVLRVAPVLERPAELLLEEGQVLGIVRQKEAPLLGRQRGTRPLLP